jgi:SanA protein|tara:strand:- start:5 stop:595 length:591 start_codon:yes stop_codon:yes gene_type:complete
MSVVYYAKYEIDTVSQGKVYNSIEEVPERKIGLVLGCSKYLSNGRKNLYFQQRIDAAKELYFSDKVKFLLVSGDNSTKYYDEPTTMKKDLIALGVPGNKVYCDYAGLSTLDSVVRTKEVFKENQFIVISQGFHVRRAIYLGLAHDIDLIGYAPQGVSGLGSLKTELRECLARGKALLDVKFLNRQPKFLGEPVIIK